MQAILEILKYTIPSIVVLVTAIVMMKYYYRSFILDRDRDLVLQDRKKTLPMRLQAYERLSLFLERITVDSLVVREQDNDYTSREFHQHLLTMVRAEYEHNLSQQIYVSGDAWYLVKNAKEGVLNIVNKAAMQVNPDGPALDLSQKIIELQMEIDTSPTKGALDFLRIEAMKLMDR
ncbi:MAG: hypothetical protein PHY99_06680 [Bacteroidales bacterium]|nr:hypothetical protein [Bacteroidales bacterium]